MKEKRKIKIKGEKEREEGNGEEGEEDKIGRNEERNEEGKEYGGRGETQGGPDTPVITCRDSRSARGLKASCHRFLFSGRIIR